jgi:hypothetical protein
MLMRKYCDNDNFEVNMPFINLHYSFFIMYLKYINISNLRFSFLVGSVCVCEISYATRFVYRHKTFGNCNLSRGGQGVVK